MKKPVIITTTKGKTPDEVFAEIQAARTREAAQAAAEKPKAQTPPGS